MMDAAAPPKRPRGRPLTARGAVRKLRKAERLFLAMPLNDAIDVATFTIRDLRIARSKVQAEAEGLRWEC